MIRRLALVALLVAALLPAAADPGFARPDAPVAQSAMKKVKAKKKACKKYKKRAARRRCLARKRRAAARKKPTAQAPSAPAPSGGTSAPGTAAPVPTPAPTEDPGHDVPVLPPSNPRALQVISGEFFLTLSKAEVLSGNVRVEFNNAYAEDPHDLHLIRKNGDGESYAFGELQSGEVEAKTLNLKAGTWQLFCALPEHAERGMSANLTVNRS